MTAFHADAVRAVFVRTWRASLRRPVPLTFSLAQPLLWLLLFGYLFQRFPVGPRWAEGGYAFFVLAGICAMTVLFGASQSGISLIRDMQTGVLRRILATPAGGLDILLGKLLADVTRLMAQATLVFLLGWTLAGNPRLYWAAAPATLLAYALFALAFSALSCLVALQARSPEGMAAFVHLVNMPVLFTSSAFAPRGLMPHWLAVAAAWNPLTLAIDLCRRGLFQDRTVDAALWLPELLALALALVALAAVRVLRFEEAEA
ncbi:MAG TPA: ABC transporter permease [Thermoanaerobaculia bacterium]|nr:ABC transporter permease [Thermoanaerobaculia bacterium]